VKVEKVFKGGKKKLLLKRIKMKTCCTVFQSPSQKAAGKGHEVEVSNSYKEQVTEHGRILQYRPSYK